jgi:hypothetical protein
VVSILNSIKKLLGISEDQTHFDSDIIMHINTVFSVLTQLGVGPEEGFVVQDELATWDDFMSDDSKLQNVKSYVYMRVKLLFDPPQSSAVLSAMERIINEFEWRLNVAADKTRSNSEENQNG